MVFSARRASLSPCDRPPAAAVHDAIRPVTFFRVSNNINILHGENSDNDNKKPYDVRVPGAQKC